MGVLRIWMMLSWIALPTVMFGGFSLLRLLNRGDVLTPFQIAFFRAAHAHAGVLLLMSLLYYTFLERTSFAPALKHTACAVIFVGILLQSGGFFLHMLIGQPNQSSIGTAVTTLGAVLLAGAVLFLAYGIYRAP